MVSDSALAAGHRRAHPGYRHRPALGSGSRKHQDHRRCVHRLDQDAGGAADLLLAGVRRRRDRRSAQTGRGRRAGDADLRRHRPDCRLAGAGARHADPARYRRGYQQYRHGAGARTVRRRLARDGALHCAAKPCAGDGGRERAAADRLCPADRHRHSDGGKRRPAGRQNLRFRLHRDAESHHHRDGADPVRRVRADGLGGGQSRL